MPTTPFQRDDPSDGDRYVVDWEETLEARETREALISAACDAEDEFPVDELEAYAFEKNRLRRLQGEHASRDLARGFRAENGEKLLAFIDEFYRAYASHEDGPLIHAIADIMAFEDSPCSPKDLDVASSFAEACAFHLKH